MDILILCNQNDAIANGVYQQLIHHQENVCRVTAEELIYASSWNHSLTEKGKSNTEIILQNGTIIRSGELKAVWSRIRFFQMLHFINEADRHYAQTEMFALYVSFLKSINDHLIDPVHTYDFAMEEENILYLKQQAVHAGLPVLDYHFTSSPKWQSSKDLIPVTLSKKSISSFHKKAPHLIWQNQPALFTEATSDIVKIWMAGNTIVEEKTVAPKSALKKLSKNLKKILLEVHFAKTSEGYKLSAINTFPVYAPQPVVDALTTLVQQKKNQSV